MEFTKIIGWIGFRAGLFIGIPLILKTIKIKSSRGVLVMTFILIEITVLCFLIRSIAIKESALIAYYLFIIVSTTTQLYLIWKFQNDRIR